MTIKELADFCGKNKSTVGRWIDKAGCKMQQINCKMQQATTNAPADFTLEEVECILSNSSLSKSTVSILMENARNKGLPQNNSSLKSELKAELTAELKVVMTEMTKAMTSAIMQSIPEIVKQTVNAIGQPRQTLIEQDYYSVLGYCCKNNLHITSSEASRIGKLATKISKEKGFEIRRVDDERYGTVGSYHVSVLDEAVLA